MSNLALPRPASLRGAVVGLAAAAVALVVGLGSTDPLTFRLAVVLALLTVAVTATLREPRAVLVGTLLWLPVLGTVRRVTSASVASTSQDVLLLLAPAAAVLLTLIAAQRGAFGGRTRLSNAVLVLNLFTLLSAANPIQGGPAIGATGLLFGLVPVLWFWVGRAFVDDRLLRRVLTVTAWLAVGAALYGLSQTFVGFTAYDQRWVDQQGYVALQVNGIIRPFGSFSSAAEYATYVSIGMLLWFGRTQARGWSPLSVAALGVLGTALVLESSRGAIILTAAGLGAVVAVRRRAKLATTVLCGALALAAVTLVASVFADDTFTSERTGGLVQHQLEGLADPFHPTKSTLGGHLQIANEGLSSILDEPLGSGFGAVTIAAQKFGSGISRGTETDPSNAAVAMGLPGLLAYLAVVLYGGARVFRAARERRDLLGYAALGVLAVTALQWLNGGSYATVVYPWLILGWTDRTAQDSLGFVVGRSRASHASRPAASPSEPWTRPARRTAQDSLGFVVGRSRASHASRPAASPSEPWTRPARRTAEAAPGGVLGRSRAQHASLPAALPGTPSAARSRSATPDLPTLPSRPIRRGASPARAGTRDAGTARPRPWSGR